jgi:hypothetical protein
VYCRVTGEVDRGVRAGAFADPDWVAAYLVTFADHYRRAFLAYERGEIDAVPDAWQLSFDAALAPETLVLQDVLLGVNAHVNYDLALALHEVGIDADRRRRHDDHRAVNEVLRRLVDVQQDRLAARYADGIADLDARFGRLDEALSMLSLREGRRNAWRGAVALSTGVPGADRAVPWLLNAVATGVGQLLLAPAASPALLARLKAVEDGSPAGPVGE